MIADTTFLSDLLKERRRNKPGPATALLQKHRAGVIRTTIISAGELAVMFDDSAAAWEWLRWWKVYPLHSGIAAAAADIDRVLKERGERLGENDNWIAGFATYYRQPVISHDEAFDRAPGVRRVIYQRA
jgi:predicted nucleic acid-binding protein